MLVCAYMYTGMCVCYSVHLCVVCVSFMGDWMLGTKAADSFLSCVLKIALISVLCVENSTDFCVVC